MKTKLAKKVVDLLRVKDLNRDDIASIVYRISSSFEGEIHISNDSLEDDIDSFYKDVISIKEKISHIYSSKYDENELLDIINFYSSATGQKVLDNQNSIMIEIMDITDKLGSDIFETLKRRL